MPYDHSWHGWWFKGSGDPRQQCFVFEIVPKNGRRPVVGFQLYPPAPTKRRRQRKRQ
jgi:hypothetical protein